MEGPAISVAVLGSSEFVTAFELMGANGFRVGEGEVKETVKKLLSDERFELIILPEDFTNVTSEMRMELLKKNKIRPIFIIIPGFKGEGKGDRLREIKNVISFEAGAKTK